MLRKHIYVFLFVNRLLWVFVWMVRCRCLSFSLTARRFDTHIASSHLPMFQLHPTYHILNTRSAKQKNTSAEKICYEKSNYGCV